ncbi:MAG TPA: PQ-loop domain-containing transporter [Candidatus Thermoplasmatota archaeon]|nr:PQ-loop domain-containing transporter [Candidatus Thermoplasmatota archaeon]
MLEPIGSVGFIVALVPQFYRTLKLGHANDVDVLFLLIVLASSVVLLLWAIIKGAPYLAVSFGANLVVWGTVLFYRLRPREGAKD